MTSLRTFLLLLGATVLVACGSAVVPENPTAEDRFRMGMEEYLDENYVEAINHFEVIRLQFPGSSVSDSARFFTGMSRYQREEYLLASYEFNQLVQGGGSRDLIPEAYYMFARCYYEMSPKSQLDQTNTSRAIDALQNFVEAYPSHPKAAEAEKLVLELISKLAKKDYEIAVLYEKMENRESALVYYTGVTDRYYNTEFADDATVGRIRMLLRLKRWALAEKAVKEFLERYPDSPLRSEVDALQRELTTASR